MSEKLFSWQGRDRDGKLQNGTMHAENESALRKTLLNSGIVVSRVRKSYIQANEKRIKNSDLALFTRQLATMSQAGVPIIQALDVARSGNPNRAMVRLIDLLQNEVESGSSLSAALRKFPKHFDALYCNLVQAGENAGVFDVMFERLAQYMEKTQALKAKVKSALMYPIGVLVVAFAVVSIIMIFVVPEFEKMFSSAGASLPLPTQIVVALSNAFVNYWWLIFIALIGGIYGFLFLHKNNVNAQRAVDKMLLKLPIFGSLLKKSCIARWTRTLATMFAAGLPLIEALETVAGAAGNYVYLDATKKIRQDMSVGLNLSYSMKTSSVFPPMVLQMCSIGEETGKLDSMLNKIAEIFETEVEAMVNGLSSLLEPVIIVVLGLIIAFIVISMYLPIFQMPQLI